MVFDFDFGPIVKFSPDVAQKCVPTGPLRHLPATRWKSPTGATCPGRVLHAPVVPHLHCHASHGPMPMWSHPSACPRSRSLLTRPVLPIPFTPERSCALSVAVSAIGSWQSSLPLTVPCLRIASRPSMHASPRSMVLTPFFGTCQDGQSGLISIRKVTVYVDSR
jgi:hypothetical protein